MIRPSSVAMGELVAVGASVKPGQIIQGLNEVSQSSFEYTPENFRDNIVACTSQGAHTDIMEATSTRLAEIIRETMQNVRQYGVPLADAIANGTSLMYSPKDLQRVAADNVYISFVNADDPFFNSSLFPTAVANHTLSYKSVAMEGLDTLQFEWASGEAIEKFLDTDHPDIRAIMENPDAGTTDAASLLTNLYELKEHFVHNGELFNFTQIKSTNIALLLKAYIILTKMRASEDPVSWLKGGDLNTYRAYVNHLWNGFTAYLLQLKNVVNAYRAQNLVVIQEREVHMKESYRDFKNTRLMSGAVKVFYTDAFFDKVSELNLSMQEVILGFFWARLNGRTLSTLDVFNNPQAASNEAQSYFSQVHTNLMQEGRSIYINAGTKAIIEFIEGNPVLKERALKSCDGKVFSDWIYSQFHQLLNQAYSLTSETLGSLDAAGVAIGDVEPEISDRTGIILQTQIVPTFLRLIGCNLAADLIADTFIQTAEDNVGDKRARLHVALINLIVDKALV